jgi:GNAT superfamily N-acetyltransferase
MGEQGERGRLTYFGHLHATVRTCWVLASDLRRSAMRRDWTDEPTLYALVIEHVAVDEDHRRQGLCRAFLGAAIGPVADFHGYDLVIVEGVQNPHLYAALERWGWECDPQVKDFYRRRGHAD